MPIPTERNFLHPAANVLPGHWTEAVLLLLGAASAAWPKPPIAVVGIFVWLLSFIYGKRRWQVWFLDAVPAFSAVLLFAPGVVAAIGLIFRISLAVLLAAYIVANGVFPVCKLPGVTGPFGVAGADVFLQRNGLEFRVRILHPAELSKSATPAPLVTCRDCTATTCTRQYLQIPFSWFQHHTRAFNFLEAAQLPVFVHELHWH